MRRPLILLLLVPLCGGAAGCDGSHAEKREQPSTDSVPLDLKAPVISEQFTLLPCPAEPKSTLDLEGCAQHRIVRSDKAINATVRMIYDRLSSRRSGAADRFVRGERAWLTYRRALCESRADLYEGGSAAGIVFADCVAEKNADHLKDVRAFERHLWMGKPIYVPGSFGRGGYGLRYKPKMLVYTGDGSSYVDELRYSTYGGPRASAAGMSRWMIASRVVAAVPITLCAPGWLCGTSPRAGASGSTRCSRLMPPVRAAMARRTRSPWISGTWQPVLRRPDAKGATSNLALSISSNPPKEGLAGLRVSV
jgi:uncharacterized protein YecT (DUF1311 family)